MQLGVHMNTSDKIAAFALVIASLSALFTGLSYFSTEASKRGQMGIFVIENQYSISNNTVAGFYDLTYEITGVISNEGNQRCQVTKLEFGFSLPFSDNLQRYYNYTKEYSAINYQDIYIDSTVCRVGWNNTIFEAGSEEIFIFSGVIPYDRYISSGDLQTTKITLEFQDLTGIITKEQIIDNWIDS